MSLTFASALRKLNTEPSIGASHQISVHLAKQFQKRRFLEINQPTRNKNCIWQPCLLTDRNEICNLYSEPSIDASYQDSVQLAKKFQGRRSLETDQSETIKNCLWRPCLLMNLDEMNNIYTGPSMIAFYQVSVHLVKRFQKRRFFRNQPIRNKNFLWRPCLLTDQDEMGNLYRGPTIDTSYQVSVQLPK